MEGYLEHELLMLRNSMEMAMDGPTKKATEEYIERLEKIKKRNDNITKG